MSSLRSGLSTFLLAGVVTAGSLLLAAPAAHAADTPLRDLAEAKGKVMGTAVTGSKLTGTYGEIAGREFNSLTPGNAMKWGSVEPSRGSHDWAEADRIVDFAEAHGQQVRGHTLLWHQQNPDWLTSGSWTRDQLGAIVQDHIATEVGRYKGRIAAWDVVNEPFNEDGTYRPTLFHTTLGQDYIAQALTGARAADPGAKLYINDYNVEGVNAKSTALYNLVKSLKERGIPIDGVGLQAHLIVGQVPSTLQQNIQRFADLGVDVAITELDIRTQLPMTPAKLTQQAADYKAVMNACVALARCTGVTVWGFTDSDSWIPDTFPGQGAATPYDENYQPKPAYHAIAEALGGTTTPPTGAWDVVNEPFNEDGTYRPTLFHTTLGQDYIAQALTGARAADPGAKLYINDYNVEGVNAKSTALYNLVKSLKERGIPIDGVGLQAHLIVGQVPSTLQQNIQRFADLGVDVAITELDIRTQLPMTPAKLTQQAADYKAVMNACVALARCTGVTVWGFTDSDSWIPDTFPGQGAATPYDENYQPKPAYHAIAEALGGTTTPPTGACTATYSVTSQWSTGYTGQVRIACSGAALASWKANWTFGAGQRITQAWNADCTQSGTAVSCANAPYNGSVPDGGSVTFGFNGSWSGSNPVPVVTLG